MTCVLCSSTSLNSFLTDRKNYFQCTSCDLIFLDPAQRLNLADEKERYLKHENNVLDKGYQNFVAPLFSEILKNVKQRDSGLDYGSGKDSAISHLLLEKSYTVKKYDPFFNNNPELLQNNYDYIIVCEVAEHFYNPKMEFEKFYSYLNPDGFLFVMTSLKTPEIDFSTWSYRRDSTHVGFYSKETCAWISKCFGFKNFEVVSNQLVRFQK
jgi:hypothetical protein